MGGGGATYSRIEWDSQIFFLALSHHETVLCCYNNTCVWVSSKKWYIFLGSLKTTRRPPIFFRMIFQTALRNNEQNLTKEGLKTKKKQYTSSLKQFFLRVFYGLYNDSYFWEKAKCKIWIHNIVGNKKIQCILLNFLKRFNNVSN